VNLPATGQPIQDPYSLPEDARNVGPGPQNSYRIDVNRGCHIRFTRGSAAGVGIVEGMAVYMYVDTPGVFYNDHGKIVPPEFAVSAGFDTETLLKQRRKAVAIRDAMELVEKQFTEHQTRELIAEQGEYRVVHIGNELYQVEFEDGTAMARPVNKAIALATFQALAGVDETPEAPKAAAKK